MFGASTATPALLMPAGDSRVLVPRHRSPRMPWMDALGGSLPALRRGSALSNGGGGGGGTGHWTRDRGGRPDEVLVEDHCGRAAERRISGCGPGCRGTHSGPVGHALMMPPDPSRFRVWPPEGLDRKPRKHESGRLGKSLRLSGVAPDAARWKWTTVLRRRRQQRPRRRRPRRGGCGQRRRGHRRHPRRVGAAPGARGSLRQCRTAAGSEVPREGPRPAAANPLGGPELADVASDPAGAARVAVERRAHVPPKQQRRRRASPGRLGPLGHCGTLALDPRRVQRAVGGVT